MRDVTDPQAQMQRALEALKRLKRQLRRERELRAEPIAIVGIGCRFPGAVGDADAFWRLLERGESAIGETPADRWDVAELYSKDAAAPGKMYVRSGGYVPDIDRFDPKFFGISEREATSMDPQQRLLLEVAWQALEDACMSPHALRGSRTGVYVGITFNDYASRLRALGDDAIEAHQLAGNALSFAPGRLAYVLGSRGPSLAVDAACASSLTTVHLACQGLRAGETDLAIAGGVNVLLDPRWTITLCKAGMLSPDGLCKTFDDAADGYVRSEGCGLVVLKRLSDALRDADDIVAVVRGTAIGHNGASGGLTVPSADAQAEVIRRALAQTGLSARDIEYVEAHGTGTRLGDPIEVHGLAQALGHDRSAPLLIGSVKTNLGHLESAAGVAGLIKTALCLRHGRLVPQRSVGQPSTRVDWASLPLEVVREPRDWPNRDAGVHRAGVSSFGGSGSNAHVILESAPASVPLGKARAAELFCVSARDARALRELTHATAARVAVAPDGELASLARTSVLGRAHFERRIALVARSERELARQLGERANGIDDAAPLGAFAGGKVVAIRLRLSAAFGATRDDVSRMRRDSALFDGAFAEIEAQLQTSAPGAAEAPVSDAALGFCSQVALARSLEQLGVAWGAVSGEGTGALVARYLGGAASLAEVVRVLPDVLAARAEPLPAACEERGLTIRLGRVASVRARSGAAREVGVGGGDGELYAEFLGALAAAYESGSEIDWAALERDRTPRRARLPGYPFSRGAFWCGDTPGQMRRPEGSGELVCASIATDVGPGVALATGARLHRVRLRAEDWVGEHRVHGRVVVPGAAWISLLSGAAEAAGNADAALGDVAFLRPLLLAEGSSASVQILCEPAADTDQRELSIASQAADSSWTVHARARLLPGRRADRATRLEAAPACSGAHLDGTEFYARLERRGVVLGAKFRWVREVWQTPTRLWARLSAPPAEEAMARHAGFIDSCFQLALLFAPDGAEPFVPIAADVVSLEPLGQREIWCELDAEPCAVPELVRARLRAGCVGAAESLQAAGLVLRQAAKDVFLTDRSSGAVAALQQVVWHELPSLASRELGSLLLVGDAASPTSELGLGLEAALRERGAAIEWLSVEPDWLQAADRISKRLGESAGLSAIIAVQPSASVPSGASGLDALGWTAALARAAQSTHGNASARLCWVTRAAQSVRSSTELVDPSASAAWGFVTSAAEEQPGRSYQLIDLDAMPSPQDLSVAAALLALDEPEPRLAVRDAVAYACRLVEVGAPEPEAPEPLRLAIDERGALQNLRLAAHERVDPAPHQVEVAVESASVNFRDVLNTLGLYPGEPGPLGAECVGVITRLGTGVKGHCVGDRVWVAMALGCAASHVLADASRVVPLPSAIDADDAAALGIAHITAEYGLCDLARLRAGQRVLIHSGAGGVGLSALRVAKRLGAEALATAHPSKWPLLLAEGARAVASSRRTDFAKRLLEQTGGERVDVVLNSLGQEFLEPSLELLRPRGFFLEIGKSRGFDARAIVRSKRPDVTFVQYDLFEVADLEPGFVRRSLERLVRQLQSGVVRPLPVEAHGVRDFARCFREMSRGHHTGKRVLRLKARPAAPPPVMADGWYVVTGGFGGIGFEVATELVSAGARSLALVGRSGARGSQSERLRSWRGLGVEVREVALDVSDERAVAELFEQLASVRRVRGVFHCAGLVQDASCTQLTSEQIERVMAAKARSAWNLHLATADLPLDEFVLFSSTTAVFGNAGQASYGAANAYLRGLAGHRRALGLPARALDWGLWEQLGMAASLNSRQLSRLRARGILPMRTGEALGLLHAARARREPCLIAAKLDLGPLAQSSPATRRLCSSTVAAVEMARAAPSVAGASDESWLQQLTAATSGDRLDLARDHVAGIVRQIMGGQLDARAMAQPLAEQGMDSLMAVEIRTRLASSLKMSLPATLLFESPSIEALARRVVEFAAQAEGGAR